MSVMIPLADTGAWYGGTGSDAMPDAQATQSRFYCVAGDLHGAPQADKPLGSLLPCNPFFATIDGKVRGTV
jgi:hypothetical protein